MTTLHVIAQSLKFLPANERGVLLVYREFRIAIPRTDSPPLSARWNAESSSRGFSNNFIVLDVVSSSVSDALLDN